MKKTSSLALAITLCAGTLAQARSLAPPTFEGKSVRCTMNLIAGEDPNDWAVISGLDIKLNKEGFGELKTEIGSVKLDSGKTVSDIVENKRLAKLSLNIRLNPGLALMPGMITAIVSDSADLTFLATPGFGRPDGGNEFETYFVGVDLHNSKGKADLSLAVNCLAPTLNSKKK